MIPLADLANELGYRQSPHYRELSSSISSETSYLLRVAAEAGVHSAYLLQTSSDVSGGVLSPKPVVLMASATTDEEANQIHRKIWNLNLAPFLIVQLPNQIRIYTGFSYSVTDEQIGLLETLEPPQRDSLVLLLSALTANSIDSGTIWGSQFGKAVNLRNRVDRRLLKNLQELGSVLEADMPEEVAHTLIGKYVYITYLRDRGILSDGWLAQQSIEPESVFSMFASVESLRHLTDALEERFNGKIFPIDFDQAQAKGLNDQHVSWIASVFSGSEVVSTAPDIIRQLHLPFTAYDFHYIPVETLSAIYEQFIDMRKEKGAIYTPEFLADYLLSEVEWGKPLKSGGKLLDPACGAPRGAV